MKDQDYFNIIPWKKGLIPESGKCYSGMPNKIYHGFRDWYGSTMVKNAIRSVESFFYEIQQPAKNSIAFERGHAFHTGVEGLAEDGTLSLFEKEVIECPTKTITSKAWQDLKTNNPENAILPESEIVKAKEMALKLYEKANEVNYFDEGFAEISFFWVDQKTGLQLKCRSDWFRPDGGGWNLDYKSSKAHYIEVFMKEMANYNYHLSAAMYLDGIYQVTGIEVEHYHFLVIANTSPLEVESYALDEASKAEGKALFRKILSDIASHVPSQKLTPKTIGLPHWAFNLT